MTNILTAICTAYCSCHVCTKGTGITASGVYPQQGITIAASRTLPFGTAVIIDNHSYTVQDRLAKKYDSRFDIYFSNHKDALRYGIRTNKVTIITHK